MKHHLGSKLPSADLAIGREIEALLKIVLKKGRNGVRFHIRDARKMERERKGQGRGVGERKEGNACPQTPLF